MISASAIQSPILKSGREQHTLNIVRKVLLICGILSSLLYLFMNVIAAMLYEGYSSFSQTVSELSAIDAPTRPLWVALGIVYGLLVIAFGYGVWKSAGEKRGLRIAGALLVISGFVGCFWPPMHQREVLAARGGTLTDTLHIVFTSVVVPLQMLAMAFAAKAFGKGFRFYTFFSLLVMIVFGIFTGIDSPQMEANLPTPWMGLWERIIIGSYMLWVAVFSTALLRIRR